MTAPRANASHRVQARPPAQRHCPQGRRVADEGMVLYRLLTWLIAAAFAPLLGMRRLLGLPAVPARFRPRVTAPALPAGAARTLWLHGASNGELTAARPVIEAVLHRAPGLRLVVTANTASGVDLVAGWALPRVSPHPAPYDQARITGRFLDAVQPCALIVIENEIWPNRFVIAARRGIPILMIGARMSERSAARWARVPGLARRLMECIAWLAPQDRRSGERFAALGLPADRLGPVLSLKSAAAAGAADPLPVPRARTLLAASTHAGEDEVVLDAFIAAGAALPDLRLILAPRHPRRRDRIEAMIRARGLSFATRSRGGEPAVGLAVYLADTLGEMDRWYSAAGITFVGGSLVAKGGHTPFEPAAHGSAILHGPHCANFAPAYAALAAAGAATEVGAAGDLAAAILALADPAAQAAQAARARAALAPFGGDAATEAILAALAAATGIAAIAQAPQTGEGEHDRHT